MLLKVLTVLKNSSCAFNLFIYNRDRRLTLLIHNNDKQSGAQLLSTHLSKTILMLKSLDESNALIKNVLN